MKKAITTCLRVALLVMTVLYPAGTVISAAFGYSFELFSVKAFAAATAVLSVCTVILDYSFEPDYFYEDANSKFLGVLLALNAPLSLVNVAFYCFECGKLSVVLCIWLSAVCCFIMSVRRGFPYTLKVVAITLVTVMVIPLVFISFVLYVFMWQYLY